jgi:hypothetical protein
VRGTQLPARVDAPALAAQPLPVQQVRAGQLRPQPGPAQPVDRLAVQLVGGRPAAQQRPAARLEAQPEVGPAGGLGRLRQLLQRAAATSVLPVRAAASTSSGSAHMEIFSVNVSLLACRAAARASS